MKQIFTNPLRAFMLAVSFLFAISLSAVEVEIDGINYEVVTKIKEATVIAKSSGKYTGKVVIPESVEYEGVSCAVTSIGPSAFKDCSGLTSVTIPNSVISIGGGAFNWCIDLTSVTIGNSVTSIGGDAFFYCSDLTSVHISDIAAWCKIDFGGKTSNPLYYAGHLFLDGEEIKDLVIPDSVTSIGERTFYGCSGLTSVTIGNSVTSIGEWAFKNCSGLTSVTIPNSVKSIGIYAFDGCSGLTSVAIPNSVKSIGIFAFYGCSGLTSVTIPNSVTSISVAAFGGCSGLTSVTIPNSVKSIESYAFDGCSGLTSIEIPNSVTSIGDYAFRDCSGLTSVIIPNSVTSIGESAFQSCSRLISVAIPNSVTSIGCGAFSKCSELTDVYCYAEGVPSTGTDVFKDSYVEYATLHVPAESIGDYKTTAPWSRFGKKVALTEEETGIENIEAENANSNDAPVYNINGMKMQDVDNLPKGIYIKGGKKYLVK